MEEIEGRCPKCWKVMQSWARNLICDFKRYNFPFKLYYCDKHGVYVWRGRKHELLDLSRNEARVEPLEKEVIERFAKSETSMPSLADYSIVKLKCAYCGGEWKQTEITCTPMMICPFCHREISKEEAKTE